MPVPALLLLNTPAALPDEVAVAVMLPVAPLITEARLPAKIPFVELVDDAEMLALLAVKVIFELADKAVAPPVDVLLVEMVPAFEPVRLPLLAMMAALEFDPPPVLEIVPPMPLAKVTFPVSE